MAAIETEPVYNPTSAFCLTSIDIGFDLRRHADMRVALPAECRSVIYEGPLSVAAEERRKYRVTGTIDEIRTALQKAGYHLED